jgi:hypothetical protein
MSTWHYPRKELAQNYLNQLNSGLNSIAIFAERRKGKTEFLLEDLAPVADAMGYRTAYINFWEKRSDPVHCIIQGIRRSLETQSPRILSRWKKEISFKVAGLQAKVTSDLEQMPNVLGEALDYLIKPKGGVVVMFDEIQQLASSNDNGELIATLRTFLDTNKRKVRAVFTGSSQDRLNKLFRHQKAAFYRGASLVDFPDMDEDFVNFLIERFQYLSKRKLSANKAYVIFRHHNRSPFIIVDLLQTMLREGIFNVDEGYKFYLANNDPDEEYRELWESMKLVDQLLIKEIILHSKPLYHKDTYELLGDIMGVSKVGRGTLQHSISRLREQGILNSVGHGQWELESKEFEMYVTSI